MPELVVVIAVEAEDVVTVAIAANEVAALVFVAATVIAEDGEVLFEYHQYPSLVEQNPSPLEILLQTLMDLDW